jgi:hypothetical protein
MTWGKIVVLSTSVTLYLMLSKPGAAQAIGESHDDHAGMPGMDHAPSAPADHKHQAEQGAVGSMSHEHMHMGAHMKFTAVRPQTPEDLKRADEIASALRSSLEKYKDYHLAIADGYKPFLPNLKQPMYHFTNYWHGFLEAFTFNPTRPTSLLYKKSPDGYQLVGAMYTAPKNVSEEKLDKRVPLSVTRWHQHVNICLPPKGQGRTADWTKFGFAGSISSKEACEVAGGRFFPVIFGWMVHVYPFENAPEKVWAH